jgi:hypothetical protein
MIVRGKQRKDNGKWAGSNSRSRGIRIGWQMFVNRKLCRTCVHNGSHDIVTKGYRSSPPLPFSASSVS